MQTYFPRLSSTLHRVAFGGSVAALLLLLPGVTARADEAHKQALIGEMFTVTHVDTMMQQMMGQMMNAQKAQMAQMDPAGSKKAMEDEMFDRISKLVSDELSWDKLKPVMTKVYSDNLTEDELSAAVTFYKTPAGQSLLNKMPAIMTSSMTAVQQQMGDLTPKIQQATQEVQAKYNGANADAAKPKTAAPKAKAKP